MPAQKVNGFLTRDAMERHIKNKGTVLRSRAPAGQRLIKKVEHIPDDATLALQSRDPKEIEAAKERINAQKLALDEQLARLDNPELGAEPTRNSEATEDLDTSTAVAGAVENVQKPGVAPGSPDVAESDAE